MPRAIASGSNRCSRPSKLTALVSVLLPAAFGPATTVRVGTPYFVATGNSRMIETLESPDAPVKKRTSNVLPSGCSKMSRPSSSTKRTGWRPFNASKRAWRHAADAASANSSLVNFNGRTGSIISTSASLSRSVRQLVLAEKTFGNIQSSIDPSDSCPTKRIKVNQRKRLDLSNEGKSSDMHKL